MIQKLKILDMLAYGTFMRQVLARVLYKATVRMPMIFSAYEHWFVLKSWLRLRDTHVQRRVALLVEDFRYLKKIYKTAMNVRQDYR